MPRIATFDRKRLIEAYQQGRDLIEVARVLQIKEKSARSIIRRHIERQNGREVSTHGGARNIKVTQEIREFLNMCLEENCLLKE